MVKVSALRRRFDARVAVRKQTESHEKQKRISLLSLPTLELLSVSLRTFDVYDIDKLFD